MTENRRATTCPACGRAVWDTDLGASGRCVLCAGAPPVPPAPVEEWGASDEEDWPHEGANDEDGGDA